jgi:hypothetical protein
MKSIDYGFAIRTTPEYDEDVVFEGWTDGEPDENGDIRAHLYEEGSSGRLELRALLLPCEWEQMSGE